MYKNSVDISNWKEKYPTIHKILKILGYVFLVTLVTGLVYFIFSIANTPGGEIKDDKLVISFLGVLATFIVIGNFAQTNRIEESLKEENSTLRERVKDCENDIKTLNQKTETIDKNTSAIDEQNTKIDHLIQELHGTSPSLNKKDLAHVLKLFIGNEGDIRKYMHLYAKFLNPKSKYLVEFVNGQKEQITLRYLAENEELVFLDDVLDEVPRDKIRYVSGVPYNEDDFLYAYSLLNEICTRETEAMDNEKQKEDDTSEISGKDQTTRKNK